MKQILTRNTIKREYYLFFTFINLVGVEQLGLEPIFDILKVIGLPREPPFGNETFDFDIAKIAGVAQRQLSLNLLVNFYISEDMRDTTKNQMMVSSIRIDDQNKKAITDNAYSLLFWYQMEQVSPGFSERYLLEPQRFKSELDEYKRYVKAMIELAGAGEKSDEFADELLNFSTKVAEVIQPKAFTF